MEVRNHIRDPSLIIDIFDFVSHVQELAFMIGDIGDNDHGIHRFFATRRTQTVVLHIVHGAERCDLPIYRFRGVLWSTILPLQQKVERVYSTPPC